MGDEESVSLYTRVVDPGDVQAASQSSRMHLDRAGKDPIPVLCSSKALTAHLACLISAHWHALSSESGYLEAGLQLPR